MLAEMEMTTKRDMNNIGTVFLDPDQKSPRAQDFEERLDRSHCWSGTRSQTHEWLVPDISGRHESTKPPDRHDVISGTDWLG